MVKKLLITLVAGVSLMVTALLAGWYSLASLSNDPLPLAHETSFNIERGDSLQAVMNRLEAQDIIDSPTRLEYLARLNGVAPKLKVGEYLITPKMTHQQMLDKFTSGDIQYYNVSLIPGQNMREILDYLNRHSKLRGRIEPKDLNRELGSLVQPAPVNGNLEGLFFADTYRVEAGTTVKELLLRANHKMQSVLNDQWNRRATGLPYKTAYEALTMASIIERETGVGHERPVISGVFYRRLNLGMRLQTDPTVIYGAGDKYKGRITRKMLRDKNPYNTYTIKGLPPTPIAAVGKEAIFAALHPQEGKSLYFVAKGDGTHYFSETLKEHNAAVRKYQLNRRNGYRSTVSQ